MAYCGSNELEHKCQLGKTCLCVWKPVTHLTSVSVSIFGQVVVGISNFVIQRLLDFVRRLCGGQFAPLCEAVPEVAKGAEEGCHQ